ncbi:MAG: hypothetical protein WEE67_10375 [Chloroflexota bacterium]
MAIDAAAVASEIESAWRAIGKRRPTEVATWLAPRTNRASGVTMREAVRYLAPGDAERLMAAYREHRPAD